MNEKVCFVYNKGEITMHACMFISANTLFIQITNTLKKINDFNVQSFFYSCGPSHISKAAPAASTKASQIPQCEKQLIIILLFSFQRKSLLYIYRLLNGWFTDNSGVYICTGNIHWRHTEIQKLPAALCAIIHSTAGYTVMHDSCFSIRHIKEFIEVFYATVLLLLYSYFLIDTYFLSNISSGSYQESLVRMLLGIEMLQVNICSIFLLKYKAREKYFPFPTFRLVWIHYLVSIHYCYFII